MQKTITFIVGLVFVGTCVAFERLPRSLYIQQTPTSCVLIPCHESPTDAEPETVCKKECPYPGTKYKTKSPDGKTCSNPVTHSYHSHE